ncbi:MAG: alkaline phosphatase [Bacteroidota bacterium]
MKKLRLIVFTFIALFIFVSCQLQPEEQKAKYVFYFIGDGMGLSQVIAAEAFQAALNGDEYTPLNFRQFPHAGLSTTHAANRLITGSAAAGTALATGHKTAIGRIGMDTSGTVPFESIAEKAKKKGMKVGIISSVSINHATPAAFYAKQKNRNMYFEIGLDLTKSDFDFFGGGGLSSAEGSLEGEEVNLYELAEESGFQYINTAEGFSNLKPAEAKVLFVNPELTGGTSMHYAIDQPEGYITLADITGKAIEYLDNDNGFFMMVEGGKIDWLCHANDMAAMIHEVLDFSYAVEEAIAFYHQHPDETLIVVTADHETGGLGLGHQSMKYESDFAVLTNQHVSGEKFNKVLMEWRKENELNKRGYNNMLGLVEKHFGIGTDDTPISLTPAESEEYHEAFLVYDESLQSEYGDYSPLTLKSTSILSSHAGAGWTTMSHTAVAVPVYSLGVNSGAFTGNLDNTDIPVIIWETIE